MTRYETNIGTIGSNLSDPDDGSRDATHGLTYEGLQINKSNLSATNRIRDASHGQGFVGLPANPSNRSHGTSQSHNFAGLPENKSNLSSSIRSRHTSQGRSLVEIPENKSNLSSSNRSRPPTQDHGAVGLPANKSNLSAGNRSGVESRDRSYDYIQTAGTPNHFINNFCSVSFGDDVSRYHVGQNDAEGENQNAQSGPVSNDLRAIPSKDEQLDLGPFCCASPSMGSQRYSMGKSISRSTGASGNPSVEFHESHEDVMEPDTSDSNVWNEHNTEYIMGSADQSYEEHDEYYRELAPMHARRRCLVATLLLCSIVATLGVALAAFRSYRSMVKFNERVFALPKDASSSYPSSIPSDVPSTEPSSVPSILPSGFPSLEPSQTPTIHQSSTPSITQSDEPSTRPSYGLSSTPTKNPIPLPTLSPFTQSSGTPVRAATSAPSVRPTTLPTLQLSQGTPQSPAPTTLRPTPPRTFPPTTAPTRGPTYSQ